MADKKMIGILAIVVVAVAVVACIFLIPGNEKDTAPQFILSYDPNGGTGDMPESKCDVGSSITVPECEFDNKINFRTFVAWNTEKDGSGTEYAPGSSISSDLAEKQTLYAQWKLYTMSDLGIGSAMSYEMKGHYSYSIYSYDLSGTVNDKLTAIGDVERTFERSISTTTSYYDPSDGKTHEKTSTSSSKNTEARDITYSGTPSKISTKWGVKDAICIEKDITDENGNTIHSVEYRDAESFIRYEATLSASTYYTGGVTLNNYSQTITLTDYEIYLD